MNSNNDILISVIIPTYNRADLVTDAIDSVLKQIYENLELLVVDDHSTDNTEEVVKSYDDPRVKYLVNERTKGAQGARNTGIFNAKGEWVAFLDSDDKWDINKLEIMVDRMNEIKESYGIIFDNRLFIKNFIGNRDFYKKILLVDNVIGGFSHVCIKKCALQRINYLDEEIEARQDIDTYMQILLKGFDAFCIDENLTKLRINATNRISENIEKKIKGYKYILNKYQYLYTQESLTIIYIRIIRKEIIRYNIKSIKIYFIKLFGILSRGRNILHIYHLCKYDKERFYRILLTINQC